jgi:hypothetical protein
MARSPALLALPLLAASSSLALAQSPEAAAPPAQAAPATRLALTGDFVELGVVRSGVSRSRASIEVVNRSPHPLDVRLGLGAGRVEAGRSLLVRIEAGALPLEVTSPALPGEVLAGELQVERGTHYALGLAWQRVLVEGGGAAATPADAQASPPPARQPAAAAEGASKGKNTKSSGRVDIGRKRKRDR